MNTKDFEYFLDVLDEQERYRLAGDEAKMLANNDKLMVMHARLGAQLIGHELIIRGKKLTGYKNGDHIAVNVE